jgi:hypothetical protein
MTMSRGRWLAVWLVALVLVVLLAIVAAAFVRRGRETAEVSPTATATLQASEPGPGTAPTDAALPTDGTLPTNGGPGAPTADPAATAGGNTAATPFRTFRRHATRAVEEGADLLAALRTAGEALDIDGVRRASDDLGDWAASEAAWLDAHPPQPCYARVHRRYSRAIGAFGEAAGITEQVAADFPFADFGQLDRAYELAEDGAADMQQAVDLAAGVEC